MTLQSAFGLALVTLATLGLIQVVLVLHGAGVLRSSAHEAARIALERRASVVGAGATAASMVRDSAGGVIEDVDVTVAMQPVGRYRRIEIQITGTLRAIGPLPLSIPISATASATAPAAPL